MKEEIREYFDSTRDLFTSIVMVCPLLVLYELGLLYVDVSAINGVDFVTWTLVYFGKTVYLVFNLLVTLFFIGAIVYLSKKKKFHINYFFPAIVESAVYAVLMFLVIVVILQNTGILSTGSLSVTARIARQSLMTKLIISLGAGIYEEIFFRLVVFGGFYYLLVNTYKADKGVSFFAACLVSSILFSLAHFFAGVPEDTSMLLLAFFWRLLAGIILVGIYYFRSFAIAVYAHAIYDIYVLVYQPGA